MSACVIWHGYVDAANGYGLLYAGGREFKAHRALYMAYKGAIPRGHVLHHVCGEKLCVNPAHLEALTPSEHMRLHDLNGHYRVAKLAQTHCRQGHEYTAENTYMESQRGGQLRRRCRTCVADRKRRSYWQSEGEAA